MRIIQKKYQVIKQKIHQLLGEMSLINASLYIINRLLTFISNSNRINKYYFVAQQLHAEPLLTKNRGQSFNILELSAYYADKHPCPRPIAVIYNRYAQGAICLAAYKADEFAGCLWYVKSRYHEDEVRCVYELLSEQSVWDFDVLVAPKFRLSPVFLKLWDAASVKMIQEGHSWSLSRISAFNPMSLASHRRMGAKVIGWAVFVTLKQWQLTFSSMSPFVHLSLNHNFFPVFKLKPPKR